MSQIRVACVQMRSSRDPAENLKDAEALVREAAGRGARFVQTPEMSNILERSREDLFAKISTEADDAFLARMRLVAADLGIHLHLGSLALKRLDGQVANRGFLIGPDGGILAAYDKIHMFDVDLANGESWRESATYTPGTEAVVADAGAFRLGMGICYDVRFPYLFRAYGHAGVEAISAPAAFTRQTGEAHWHVLQRARAIENGCYMISAAQGGLHADGRETFGHSIVVGPWGDVVAQAEGDEPGTVVADLDLSAVAAARAKIPALRNDRPFTLVDADRARLRSLA